MSDDSWEKLQALFEQAIQLAPDARAAFAKDKCGADEALLKKLLRLIHSHESQTRLGAIVRDAAAESAEQIPATAVPEAIGAYRIIEVLGHGGMGAVYLAERADRQFEHKVAIKVVPIHSASANVVERFRAERQILASLNHPNIATLLDGGETADGLPYLVMEYVPGKTITEFCDQERYSITDRLNLLLRIFDAVQYAHQNLVVHRDIKPSNILVTEQGEPKLLDFGVAKMLRTDPAAGQLTMADMRVLTPDYASPEQIRGSNITTATDVYTLGMLLYELLTGHSPYRLASYSAAEIAEVVCERVPERPSECVAALGNGDEGPGIEEISRSRNMTPARLEKAIAGDLDNIVMKALRKEPENRYTSVNQFAEDIERFLAGLPVSARAASWGYKASKFALRNKVGLAVAASILAAFVLTNVFYTARLTAERDRAQLEADKVSVVAEYLTDLFSAADPNEARGETVTAAMLLDRGAQRLEADLEGQPEIQAEMATRIGRSYSNMGEYEKAQQLLERALALSTAAYGLEEPRVAELHARVGYLQLELGEYTDALASYSEARRQQAVFFGPKSLETASSEVRIAGAKHELGEYEEAEATYQQAIETLRSTGTDGRHVLAQALYNYGYLLRSVGRIDEEEPLLLEAYEIRKDLHGDVHPSIASTLNALGNHYNGRGNLELGTQYLEQSLDVKRELYDENNIQIGRTLANLGMVHFDRGEMETAEQLSREALVIFKSALGEDHPHVAFLMGNIANTIVEMGRFEEGLKLHNDGIERIRKIFGEDHIEYANSMAGAGWVHLAMANFDEAKRAGRIADEIYRAEFEGDHGLIGNNLVLIAQADSGLGDLTSAVDLFREALAIFDRVYDEFHTDIADTNEKLASTLLKQGDAAAAERAARISVEQWTTLGADTKNLWRVSARLGETIKAQERYQDAADILVQAYDKSASILSPEDPQLSMIQGLLFDLYTEWGKPDEAAKYQSEIS